MSANGKAEEPGTLWMNLQGRFEKLHPEMAGQFRRIMTSENQGPIYALWGWELLASCTITHYLLEVRGVEGAWGWPYALVWGGQIVAAIMAVRLFRKKVDLEESPLRRINMRIWTLFLLFCGNVVTLTAVAGLPAFAFLLLLTTLSSFAFSVLATILSRRFVPASLTLFVTGLLIASFPSYGFLFFGTAWFLILEAVGIAIGRNRTGKDLAGSREPHAVRAREAVG